MTIETKRLILRPWRDSDAEALYRYASDERIGPPTGWPAHTSVENSREIIGSVLSERETYAVCLRGTDVPIGSVGIIIPARTERAGERDMEIGCWIGVPYWGNGYVPEAIRRLQVRAFDELGCEVLWYGWFDGNEKSRRCGEKCGFIYHHTEAGKLCLLIGEVRTEHFACLKAEDWRQMV